MDRFFQMSLACWALGFLYFIEWKHSFKIDNPLDLIVYISTLVLLVISIIDGSMGVISNKEKKESYRVILAKSTIIVLTYVIFMGLIGTLIIFGYYYLLGLIVKSDPYFFIKCEILGVGTSLFITYKFEWYQKYQRFIRNL